jgi:dGTPase
MGQRKIWEKLLSSERPGAGKAPGTAERTAFQQDYDRIVFTSAFRRMKDKTQVFPLSKSDYVRTRLTHSLEASCVGRSLGCAWSAARSSPATACRTSNPGDFGAIVAAACLAHDIGNPPFGHAGEDAIREWFRNSGLLERHDFTPAQKADFERYEGNAQGFRIVTRLQSPANPGLQLTSAVLATFTKYPRPSLLDTELDGKSGKKFGFFQQDADNFRQVARSTGLVERIPGTAWRRHPLAFPGRGGRRYLLPDRRSRRRRTARFRTLQGRRMPAWRPGRQYGQRPPAGPPARSQGAPRIPACQGHRPPAGECRSGFPGKRGCHPQR